MIWCLLWGLLFPFLGTVLGAGICFCKWSAGFRPWFYACAAGLMASAGLFGLVLPGVEISFWTVPGVLLGIGFLMLAEGLIPRRGKTAVITLAIVLHNIPEGMAVGVGFGSWLTAGGLGLADALSIGTGIALQNLPDGAMVTLPMTQEGMPPRKAFVRGVLSGLVEPVAACIMLISAGKLQQFLPAMMGFAGGAMGYVVIRELLPAMELREKPVPALGMFLLCFFAMAAVAG